MSLIIRVKGKPLKFSDDWRFATDQEKKLLVPFLLWKNFVDWHNPPAVELKRVSDLIERSQVLATGPYGERDEGSMLVYWPGESQPERFLFNKKHARSDNYYPDQLDYIYDP